MSPAATPDQSLRSTARLLLAIGPVLALLALAYRYGLPEEYQATAKVEVGTRSPAAAGTAATEARRAGLLTDFRYLQSEEFFTNALAHLELPRRWANALPPGRPATPADWRLLFRQRVRIEAVPHSQVFAFHVSGPERAELAPVANELAELFRARRLAQTPAGPGAGAAVEAKLRGDWEAANEREAAAREKLESVAAAALRSLTNQGFILYEPAALEALRAQRVRLESESTAARAVQDQLRAFNPEQLRQILPTMTTNVLLDKSLDLLIHARNELAEATATRGADSPAARTAAADLTNAEAMVRQITTGILTARETDVTARRQTLDALTDRLAHARSSAAPPPLLGDTNYAAAQRAWETARNQRDSLTNQLALEAARAVRFEPLVAEIVDAAVTPVEPISPSPRLARGGLIGGALLTLLGVTLWLLPAPGDKQAPARR